MNDLINQHLDIWTSAIASKNTAGRGNKSPSPAGEGRGEGNPTNTHKAKVTAYGIKKLRELILELAVRGKLVPQDPNDEPASVLLEKISEEKARLLITGEIKKAILLPEVGESEITFNLPPRWQWVRFGSIAQHNSGKTLDRGRNSGKLRDYITTSNLYWGRFDLDNIRQMPITDDELQRCTAKKGDLLICEGGEAGRAAVWPYNYDVCFQNHVHRARFYGQIDPYFAYRFFEKLNATGEIDQHRKGVGISNMSSKALASIVMPLPPLAEQHRIAAKVDELMALCDQLEQQQTNNIAAHQTLVQTLLDTLIARDSVTAGNAGAISGIPQPEEFEQSWSRIADHFDTLFTTESSIDQLKQTLLQLAVMGKLVSQDSNDVPANLLLEEIRKAKVGLTESGKIKKQNPLPEINDDEKFFPLPKNWVWARLQEVIDVRDGTHDSPKDAFGPNTYPLVTSKNFENGKIDFEGARKISAEDHFEISKRSLVEKYDILFSMIGGNLGNQVMVNDDRPFSVKNVALFKYYSKELTSPFFVKKYMEHLALDLQEKAIGGAQPFVSLGFLRNLVFALPPINEQHRIVAKVNELMALCDALKARIAAAQTMQLQLADAIVEQAVA